MKFFRILFKFIKAQFVCIHLPSSLTVDKRVELLEDDGEYETWMTSCTCKCGEKNVMQKFTNSKDFLNRTGFFVEK